MNYLINFAIICALGLAVFLSVYVTFAAIDYAKKRQALNHWNHRPRARIVKVGRIILEPPVAIFVDWKMDTGCSLAIDYHPVTSECAFWGYTITELKEIEHRAAEWVDTPA